MRTAFIETLIEQADVHDDVFLAVGDLGFNVVEPFAKYYPDRFLNAGVAEQNMTGVAAGLSRAGYNVFTYSIANFPTLRCLEQIRNDVCYHGANVKVVSVGAGLAYGQAGYSHHGLQDVACMRTLPGMLMATPCDAVETRAVTRYLCRYDGPAYLRLGKSKESLCSELLAISRFPAIRRVHDGNGETAILACGSVTLLATQVSTAVDASLYSAVLWSDDADTRQTVINLIGKYSRVVVIEEHLIAGGFGSFVRQCLETHPELQSRVRCLALDNRICGHVGSQDYLRQLGGLTAGAIERAVA